MFFIARVSNSVHFVSHLTLWQTIRGKDIKMSKSLVGALFVKCLNNSVFLLFWEDSFHSFTKKSHKNSIWTHNFSPFFSHYRCLSSHSHLISPFCVADGYHPFWETFVGGFFGLGSSSAAVKYFPAAPASERASLHEIMSCGAQRRQTSSQLNHSTSNPSITHHLLG